MTILWDSSTTVLYNWLVSVFCAFTLVCTRHRSAKHACIVSIWDLMSSSAALHTGEVRAGCFNPEVFVNCLQKFSVSRHAHTYTYYYMCTMYVLVWWETSSFDHPTLALGKTSLQDRDCCQTAFLLDTQCKRQKQYMYIRVLHANTCISQVNISKVH